MGSTFLRLERKSIDVLTAVAFECRDRVRADPLRHEAGLQAESRVIGQRTAVRSHRHAGHAFYSTCDHQILPAGSDLLGRDVDGFETRRTEAIELDARDRLVPVGIHDDHLGDVATLLTDR